MFKAYLENQGNLNLDKVSSKARESYNNAVSKFIPNIDDAIGELLKLNKYLENCHPNKIDSLFKTIVDISLAKIFLERFYTPETRKIHLEQPTYINTTDNTAAKDFCMNETVTMIKQDLNLPSGIYTVINRAFIDKLPVPQRLPLAGSLFKIHIVNTFCENTIIEDSSNGLIPLNNLARDVYLKSKNWLLYSYLLYKYPEMKLF